MVGIHDIAQSVATSGGRGLRLRQGKIASVEVGSVTVAIGAADAVAGVRYLASYIPTANDAVWMLTDGATVLVLGKLA